MKYGFLKSVLFLSSVSIGAAMVGRAIINTFAFDIFAKCVNDPSTAGDYMCRNATDLIQFLSLTLAAFIFFAIMAVFFIGKTDRRKSLIKITALSLAYYGLILASWRYLIDLQSSFVEFYQFRRAVPESITEYALSLYSRLTDVVVGVILGFAVWLPGKVNANAIEASNRKEPRLKFSATESPAPKKTTTKKAATKKAAVKKPAAKKTPAKKPATKKKAPAKK